MNMYRDILEAHAWLIAFLPFSALHIVLTTYRQRPHHSRTIATHFVAKKLHSLTSSIISMTSKTNARRVDSVLFASVAPFPWALNPGNAMPRGIPAFSEMIQNDSNTPYNARPQMMHYPAANCEDERTRPFFW
jgi:hypothetical protein